MRILLQIKHLLNSLKKKYFEELIPEIFILELMVQDTEKHGKTLMSYSIMIKIISTQIIKVLMLIDVKSNL